ncbi:hypothetical protein [Tomitella fengzijianii]|uniref:Uncharacterized protein n=1 Tax=Tomitella fengzijianii TaxID=2597660 RepID=A0A516X4R3_9ACTN|nr:hypothetical protein [Tomitella fengzijianii]QDQ97993.1 hypothetical protein FO059_12535 [Tomitella fengzijianii]
MAYAPQQWRNGIEGGTPTSAKRFNHIETGIADVDDAISDLEAAVTYLSDTKAPQDRKITASTGLTGGGNLTADRTIAADFGTSSGTVCEGNDSRLADQRTPNDRSVSHTKLTTDLRGDVESALRSDDARILRIMEPADYDALGANTDPNTIYLVYED